MLDRLFSAASTSAALARGLAFSVAVVCTPLKSRVNVPVLPVTVTVCTSAVPPPITLTLPSAPPMDDRPLRALCTSPKPKLAGAL